MADRRGAGAAWDLPTRVFHWTLALLVVFSFVTGRLGGAWMPWHMKSGYTILTLVLFRIAWGFAGPLPARFAHFVRGPAAVATHARALQGGAHAPSPGHTPLGGWMVIAFLAGLALQASTGLFSNDESHHEGPLAVKVSNAIVDRMSMVHGYNQWVLVALVALHVAAIAFYLWRVKADILRPMIVGARTEGATTLRALALLAVAGALVYLLVVVYPAP